MPPSATTNPRNQRFVMRNPSPKVVGRDGARRYACGMRAVVCDPAPPEFEALLERRRRSGAGAHDEVWKGVLHIAPAPQSAHAKLDQQLARLLDAPAQAAGLRPSGPVNIGGAADYRVPDRALLRPGSEGTYLPTAALVVEIVSPGDETWDKLPFYAAHKVDELLIVDVHYRTVDWLALESDEYGLVSHSGL